MPNVVNIDGTSYEIPASIEEISIRKFIQLRSLDPNNYQEYIEWAIPELNLSAISTNTKKIERELANVMALINDLLTEVAEFMASDRKIQVPASVTLLGLTVALKPGLLTSLPYWPYVQVKNIIQQEQNKPVFEPTNRYPEILAHYLYSTVTKSKYNEEKAEEFIMIVDEMPMVEAIQVGNFFLLKYKGLYLSRMSVFLTNLNLLKLRLRYRFSKFTATLTRSKPYRVVIF